jgi:hypothetical protein
MTYFGKGSLNNIYIIIYCNILLSQIDFFQLSNERFLNTLKIFQDKQYLKWASLASINMEAPTCTILGVQLCILGIPPNASTWVMRRKCMIFGGASLTFKKLTIWSFLSQSWKHYDQSYFPSIMFNLLNV